MRLIIAGSRGCKVMPSMGRVLHAMVFYDISVPTAIVSGGCREIDRVSWDEAGELLAEFYGIPKIIHPAAWSVYGDSAGPRRNYEMEREADALLAFYNGQSKGTWDMIKRMRTAGKPFWIVSVPR